MKAEQLRKSILQLAIQGKLVPQDPNDEPASVLLERIRAEKQRLIKEGKIKKDKNDSVIFKGDDNRHYEKVGSEVKDITDDLPFEIPDNWVWCRLNDIIILISGTDLSPDKYNSNNKGIPYITGASNFINSILNINRWTEYPTTISDKGDLLITCKGTIGEMAYNNVGVIHIARQVMAIRSLYHFVSYIRILLETYITSLKKAAKSMIPGISRQGILQCYFPLPPLAEQVRIVAEIEKFEPLIAEYNKLEQQATKLDEEIYDKLKKSILQYAIQGKLVPQDPNDEPASVLLERIRAEKKAKLGKKYVDSYIYKGDDNCYYEHIAGRAQDEPVEVPFDIPKGWSWSRIVTISDSYIGLTYKPTDIVNDGGYIVLRSSNIKDGKICLEDIVKVSSSIPDKLKVRKNDIIICARNGSKKLVGKSAIVDLDAPNLTFGAFMAICRTPLFAYVSKFLLTACFFEQLAAVSGTTTINQLTQASFNSFLVPIPPLAEQNRIVAKINEIFAMM